MLPLKPIKEILKQECNSHQISIGAVIESRNFLEKLMHELSKKAMEEFTRLNDRRRKLGLPKLKRLNSWAVRKASEKVLKQLGNNEMGSQSKPPGIGSPGGTMKKTKEATKPEVTDDQKEVI